MPNLLNITVGAASVGILDDVPTGYKYELAAVGYVESYHWNNTFQGMYSPLRSLAVCLTQYELPLTLAND